MSELDRRAFLAALPGGAAPVSGVAPADAGAQPVHTIARFKPRPLLQADMSRSLDQRVLAKPVHARQLIDDMESDAGWIASATVERSYTIDRARHGTPSMRVSVKQRDEAAIAAARSPNGSFNGQAVLMEHDPGRAPVRLLHFNLVGPDTATSNSSRELVLKIKDMHAPWVLVAKAQDGSGRMGEATGAGHVLPRLA